VIATYRLYRDTPYRTEFDATVSEELAWDGRPAVVLDATCFYPSSGGQPNDLGTLEGIPVLDVIEEEERIIHVLATSLAAKRVHGVVDWPRRFDHMQQHTGQHILSGACESLLQAATVSFHIGSESSTIDIAAAALQPEDAFRAEDLANRVVFENRPVLGREYDESEVAALSLRKAPTVHGKIRVVTVHDFDASACGGTHVAMTGEVGNIHIHRWERRRAQTRVEFLCGWRALRAHRSVDSICQSIAGQLSVGIQELPESISRQVEAEQRTRREMASLREKLMGYDVSRLAGEAVMVNGVRILQHVLEDYDANQLRYLAQNIVQQERGMIVLLAVAQPSPQICMARSADVEQDMMVLFREVMAPLGGRGGGRPQMALGGGVAKDQLHQALQAAFERVGGRS
jgi:alanyl-tRNA synthetase